MATVIGEGSAIVLKLFLTGTLHDLTISNKTKVEKVKVSAGSH